MKLIKCVCGLLLAGYVFVYINGCKKTPGCTDTAALNFNQNAQVDDGSCKYTNDTMGIVSFYFDQNGANAVVSIDTQKHIVIGSYQDTLPACGIYAMGCANFSLHIGTYAYTATSPTSSWSGNVTVAPNQCGLVLLKQATGSVVFWTDSTKYGIIDVRMNIGSGSITNAVTNGVPDCGRSGCVTFDLQPGTYNYNAYSLQGSANWSGSVTITTDGCQKVHFQ